MGCMKCGKKLGQSQVFCDECLEKMAQCPIQPGTVVKLPDRPVAPAVKKRSLRRRYFWNPEDKIDMLRTRVRWLVFAFVVTFLCFLVAIAVIFWMLYQQGRLDFFPLNLLFA